MWKNARRPAQVSTFRSRDPIEGVKLQEGKHAHDDAADVRVGEAPSERQLCQRAVQLLRGKETRRVSSASSKRAAESPNIATSSSLPRQDSLRFLSLHSFSAAPGRRNASAPSRLV